MALRKIIETEGKVLIQTPIGIIENGEQKVLFSAYIKVISIYGDKSQLTATVNFKDGEKSFNKEYQVSVSVETNAANFIAQAYNHLKTLPEFAGATDC